jgi:hypothetical protein
MVTDGRTAILPLRAYFPRLPRLSQKASTASVIGSEQDRRESLAVNSPTKLLSIIPEKFWKNRKGRSARKSR